MTDIAPENVEDQLARILENPDFAAGKQLGHFLQYIVEQYLVGSPKDITQYSIAVDALGYGDDFDPTTNPSVRVLAGKLRRALDRYYLGPGIDDAIRIDIPKGTYVPIFNDSQTKPGHLTPPASDAIVNEISNADLSDLSIAVVHFESLKLEGEYLYLSKGLTGEILHSLTRFSGLRVLGPLFLESRKQINYNQIYHEYGARFLLQGGVRNYGTKIRITIDLTDTLSSTYLWGQTFEYDLGETALFTVEDEVTSQVVGKIADGAGIIFKKLQSDTYYNHLKLSAVTNAVLKYNNVWMTLDRRDWKETLEAIQKALKKEPQNALLIALLANTYYGDVIYELGLVSDSFSQMEPMAQKAVSLDPNLQIARYNVFVQNCFRGRAQGRAQDAQRIVAMNPNHAMIVAGCGTELTTVGEYELAKELIERAKKLNPHYPSWYHFVDYVAHYRREQYEMAWNDALKIHVEGLLWHPLLRVAVLGKLGRTKEAGAYLDDLLQLRPDFTKRPREIIRLIFVIDEHIDMIWDGLCEAGINN